LSYKSQKRTECTTVNPEVLDLVHHAEMLITMTKGELNGNLRHIFHLLHKNVQGHVSAFKHLIGCAGMTPTLF
jgi:hypothetical protein